MKLPFLLLQKNSSSHNRTERLPRLLGLPIPGSTSAHSSIRNKGLGLLDSIWLNRESQRAELNHPITADGVPKVHLLSLPEEYPGCRMEDRSPGLHSNTTALIADGSNWTLHPAENRYLSTQAIPSSLLRLVGYQGSTETELASRTYTPQ